MIITTIILVIIRIIIINIIIIIIILIARAIWRANLVALAGLHRCYLRMKLLSGYRAAATSPSTRSTQGWSRRSSAGAADPGSTLGAHSFKYF